MDRCDVCNEFLDYKSFYALLPQEVICCSYYWKNLFRQQWSYVVPLFCDDIGMISSLAKQQIKYNTAWLVCPECAGHFSFDQSDARERARLFMKDTEIKYPYADEDLVINAAFKAIKELKAVV